MAFEFKLLHLKEDKKKVLLPENIFFYFGKKYYNMIYKMVFFEDEHAMRKKFYVKFFITI